MDDVGAINIGVAEGARKTHKDTDNFLCHGDDWLKH
jgi:hypothetical protein